MFGCIVGSWWCQAQGAQNRGWGRDDAKSGIYAGGRGVLLRETWRGSSENKRTMVTSIWESPALALHHTICQTQGGYARRLYRSHTRKQLGTTATFYRDMTKNSQLFLNTDDTNIYTRANSRRINNSNDNDDRRRMSTATRRHESNTRVCRHHAFRECNGDVAETHTVRTSSAGGSYFLLLDALYRECCRRGRLLWLHDC